jgi:beta-lactamase class A
VRSRRLTRVTTPSNSRRPTRHLVDRSMGARDQEEVSERLEMGRSRRRTLHARRPPTARPACPPQGAEARGGISPVLRPGTSRGLMKTRKDERRSITLDCAHSHRPRSMRLANSIAKFAAGPALAAAIAACGTVSDDPGEKVGYASEALTESQRIVQLLQAGTDGQFGFILKPAGGAVMENFNENVQYEPASSIKILVATHILRNIDAGHGSLHATTSYFPLPANSSCPTGTGSAISFTLAELLEMMLENSDNSATKALIDFAGGFGPINATAQAVGMTSTVLAIDPGCAPSENLMTQTDAATLYEGIANGTLLTPGSQAILFASMPRDAGDFTGTLAASRSIVDQEAPAFGLTASEISQFKTKLDLHYKAGGDEFCTSSNCATNLTDLSISGIAAIPTCSGTSQTATDYLWGLFIFNGTNNANTNNTFFATEAEPLRGPIRQALSTWATCSATPPPVTEIQRIVELLRAGTPNGQFGFILEPLASPTPTESSERNVDFDGTGTIKVLVAMHLLRQVDAGLLSLTDTAPLFPLPPNSSCPTGTGTPQTLPLGQLLEMMLENLDNAATRAVIDATGGVGAINIEAATLGLSSAFLATYPGCGVTNTLSLDDTVALFKGIANASFVSAKSQAVMYASMPADAGDFSGTLAAARSIVDQEAPAAGLTAFETNLFKTKLDLHYKAGADEICLDSACASNISYDSIGGIAVIPTCNGSAQTSAQYLWGLFADNGTNNTAETNAFTANEVEPLRAPIRTALSTWATCSAPPPGTFGAACNNNNQCHSFVCQNGACVPPSCSPTCNQGAPCGANGDCGSDVCGANGLCQKPACSPNCSNGLACNNNGDCSSFVCTNNLCAPSSCSPTCAHGAPCGANSDCTSKVCTQGKCQ